VGARRKTGYAIATSDGTPLFYRISGRADADHTVVLCDGIGCDGFVWKYLREDLADRYRLIHWHYRGHGRSPKPHDPEQIGPLTFADDLQAVLDETETESATLMGHSMGVQVILEAYRRHPQRVSALILVCGAPGHLLKTFRGTGSFETLLPTLRKTIDRAPRFFNAMSRVLVPTRFAWSVATKLEVDPELVNSVDFMPYLRGLARVEPRYFVAVLERAAAHSAHDVLEQISVPTLVIGGEKDGFTPPKLSESMAESIPGSELLMVDRGTHTAPLERPGLVAEAIRGFLGRKLEKPLSP
jgi:pimeloyl-ACP methyl ester carboxylesterase